MNANAQTRTITKQAVHTLRHNRIFLLPSAINVGNIHATSNYSELYIMLGGGEKNKRNKNIRRQNKILVS